MAPPAARLRVLPPLHRLERCRPEGGEAIHRQGLDHLDAGAVRLGGSARAGLPQDDPAPGVRQVHVAPPLHPARHQQHLLPLHLRARLPQRHLGAARDPGLDHQRLCAAAEGGAQDVPGQGAHPAPQAQEHQRLPAAALLLYAHLSSFPSFLARARILVRPKSWLIGLLWSVQA